MPPQNNSGLVGTWQLYEYGWSPGSGYFVDEVPSVPAQTITFGSSGTVQTTGEQFKGFDSDQYRVVQDSIQLKDYVEFTKSNGDTFIMYITQLTADSLTLDPPCIEGCHYGFTRVQASSPKQD